MRYRNWSIIVATSLLCCVACDDDEATSGSSDVTVEDTTGGDVTTTGDATDPTSIGDATTTTDDVSTTTTDDATTDLTIPPGECAPLEQSGCADMERCVLDQTGAPTCTASPELPTAPGETCLSGECGPGAQCVTIDSESTCRAICELDSGAGCASDQACSISAPGGGPWGYCGAPLNVTCDLLEQSGCAMDEACIAARDSTTMEFVKRCFPAGEGVQGEACGSGAGNCAPKHICLSVTMNGMSAQQCIQYCDESLDDADCPTGTACVDGASLGLEGDEAGVGICR